MSFEVIDENDEGITFTLGHVDLEDDDGRTQIRKVQAKVSGEVWRVHRYDADPFPSSPHAHCIEGRGNYAGLKMHLGTRRLYRKATYAGLRYPRKEFDRLCRELSAKLGIALPLSAE